jgi:hypothetical protein
MVKQIFDLHPISQSRTIIPFDRKVYHRHCLFKPHTPAGLGEWLASGVAMGFGLADAASGKFKGGAKLTKTEQNTNTTTNDGKMVIEGVQSLARLTAIPSDTLRAQRDAGCRTGTGLRACWC